MSTPPKLFRVRHSVFASCRVLGRIGQSHAMTSHGVTNHAQFLHLVSASGSEDIIHVTPASIVLELDVILVFGQLDSSTARQLRNPAICGIFFLLSFVLLLD